MSQSTETDLFDTHKAADMSDKDANSTNEGGKSVPQSPLTVSTANTPPTTTNTVSSPRNEFYVSQRMTPDFESNRINSLSVEEQEILANIQDLQLQLMKVRFFSELLQLYDLQTSIHLHLLMLNLRSCALNMTKTARMKNTRVLDQRLFLRPC